MPKVPKVREGKSPHTPTGEPARRSEPPRGARAADPRERTRAVLLAPASGRLRAARSGAEKKRAAEKERDAAALPKGKERAAARRSPRKGKKVPPGSVGAVIIRTLWKSPEEATRYLLSRAEGLVSDGVQPRLPVESYLDALVPVLAFIHEHAALFSDANLGAEVCAAAEAVAQELHAVPETALQAAAQRQLRTREREQESLSTGALLLTVYRDAVRRVARGPRGNLARERFGLADEVDARDGLQIAEGIERFLTAARELPEYVLEAGLSKRQLAGLRAQARVIRARTRHRREPGTFGGGQRFLVLHAALEYFFDRFSAAVTAKLFDLPFDRIRGLKLVPRPRDRA